MPTSPPALPGSLLPQTHYQYAQHLFTNALFSDCTITSQNRKFHLHRAILAPRCEFFHSCFLGGFEEASSTSIAMHDDDPDVLERMLQWLYTLEFPYIRNQHYQQSGSKLEHKFPWTGDLNLWIMADKYGLSILMEQCVTALLETADRAETAASSGSSPELVESFKASAEDFVDMMVMLFSECPARDDVLDLRNEMLAIMAPVIAKFMREVSVLEELVTDIPGFAVLLVETLSKGEPEGLRVQKDSRRRRRRSLSSEVSAGSSRDSLGSSRSGSASLEAGTAKTYIPMNEDSEDEME